MRGLDPSLSDLSVERRTGQSSMISMSSHYTRASLRSLWGMALRTSGAITNIASKLEHLVKPGEGAAGPGGERGRRGGADVAIQRAGRKGEGRSGND